METTTRRTTPPSKLEFSSSESDLKLPLWGHLEELRKRLFRAAGWIALGMIVSAGLTGRILDWIIAPVGSVIYTSPVEPFMVHLKVAFFGGLCFGFPMLMGEVWGFLKPAMRLRSPDAKPLPIGGLIAVSFALFLLGGWVAWHFLIPMALDFLMQFGSEVMVPMLTVDRYISFVGWIVIGCGFLFQMPIVVIPLTRMGVVTPQFLVQKWRIALLGILVLAAIVSPPDLVTQILLAIPLVALYAVSIAVSYFLKRKGNKRETN